VHKLIHVLDTLVNDGNTVVVIEHHLDIIKVADWIIDMGPEGGDGGGTVVAQGAPEDIVRVKESKTGYFLKHVLDQAKEWDAKEQAVAKVAKRGRKK